MDNPFKRLESRYRLKRTSSDHDAPGVHAAGSYHYRPAPWGGVQAYDYGDAVNSRAKLTLTATLLLGLTKVHKLYRGVKIREVFYGRVPYVVKDGVVYPWAKFDPGGSLRAEHMNHVHVALSE